MSNDYLSRLEPNSDKSANLTISYLEMVTALDAQDMFMARPDLDIIFVMVRERGCAKLTWLNACFQRCAMVGSNERSVSV